MAGFGRFWHGQPRHDRPMGVGNFWIRPFGPFLPSESRLIKPYWGVFSTVALEAPKMAELGRFWPGR